MVGMTEANATATIMAVDNLTVGSVTDEYSDTVAAGLVISQTPAPNTPVLIGSSVDMVVSLGQPLVPNVVGMTEPSATGAITAVDNLTVGSVTDQYSDTVAAGLVISQTPAPNTPVAIGSSVDLVVSLGRPEVPDVVGMTEANAVATVTGVDNLTTSVAYEYSDTVASGLVISQSPASGTVVPIGSVVDLIVSYGQPEVPNVVDMTESEANLAIVSAGLTVGVVAYEYSDTVEAGIVINQEPEGGTTAAVGSSVNLVVSLGQPVVPDVMGMTEANATAAITAVDNLTVGSVTDQYSDTVAAGLVISQTPAPNTPVLIGSSVGLIVSLGQPEVPDVVGMTEANATAAITAVDNLTVGSVTDEYSDTVAAGLVISQTPAPNTPVAIGSSVDLVLSLGPPLVPDVVGMTEPNAIAAITAIDNLNPSVIYEHNDTVANGVVISQSPAPNTPVLIGSSVDLVVSLGQPLVPDVAGMTEPNATAAITAVDNLAVGTVTNEYNDTVAAGLVVSQNPAPNTPVLMGSSVDLVVSMGQPVVPNVVGMTEANAVAAITAIDNLTMAVSYDYNDTVAVGAVVSQNPAGETAVPIGSTVYLVVSLGAPHIVPNVVGETEADANSLIVGAGLAIGSIAYEFSDTIAAGTVISQNPVGGTTVPGGSSVDLVVSLGEAHTVPNVVGQTEADANSIIVGAGLTLGSVTYEHSDTVPGGHVISQNPAAGGVLPGGGAVDLVVSSGRAVVPDVVGETESAASAAITGMDLMVAATYEHHNSIPANIVISQNPVAGTEVSVGSTVNIVVSLGRPVVPGVVGYTESEAVTTIEAVDLVSSITYEYNNTVAAGTVISQSPAGGTVVDIGTTVNLAISLGRPEVPGVVGLTLGEAVAAIEAVDNLAAAPSYRYDNNTPFGRVISQNPAAGTAVNIGSAINVVVSLGQPVVPGVVGRTEAEAIAAITAVDSLTVGAITRQYSNTVPAGVVISQNPTGGTAVPVASTVNLVISLGKPIVPNVVGKTEAEAITSIVAVDNLSVGTITDRYHDIVAQGLIISQSPAPNTPVLIGSFVDIVVSLGQPVVPNVVGMAEADARSLILDSGLSVGNISYQYNASVPPGMVISQDPSSGMVAPVGYRVNLVVSGVTVPSVVGMTKVDANSTIVDANLALGSTSYRYSSTVPVGKVISQTPTAGTTVRIYSTVHIVISGILTPNVTNMLLADANTAITDANLTLGIVDYEYSDTAPVGVVMSQTPSAGTPVPIGTGVNLVVSSGPPTVPNVVGRSLAEANSTITAVDNLRVGTVSYEFSNTVGAGFVIGQDPVGGTVVPMGSSVNLVVSLGQPRVPNVVGMTELGAVTAITAVDNLTAGITSEYSDTVAAGLVISQSPAPNTPVLIGSSVDLVVSLGQPEVPDVVGMTEPNAALLVASIDNLTVGSVSHVYSNTVAAGMVISHDPAGGTTVEIGSTVDLLVSLGRPIVPNAVGLTEPNAAALITAVDNLTVGTVTYEHSDTVTAGLVISQSPIGGAAVSIGSSVNLMVSLGRPNVPNVVGMPEANAVAAITAVDNLAVGNVTYEYNETIAQWLVISQNPVGGTVVAVGSLVDLLVSLGRPIEVPNVVGMTQADANLTIVGAELTVGAVTYEYSDTIPEDRVISQHPVYGTIVPIWSAIDLVVSLGQPEVPDVVGKTEAEANSTITAIGNLTVGSVSYQYSETVPPGLVISQDPNGGTRVPIGSSVDLVVSAAVVPAVLGMTKTDANSAITSASLVIGQLAYRYDEVGGAGTIIEQSPAQGTLVPVGSAVNIVVSLGQPVDVMLSGGSRLVELQNSDGGWDVSAADENPENPSDSNILALAALGLSEAYYTTADSNIQAALQSAKGSLLNKIDNFTVTDGALAVELDNILGGTTCSDHVMTNFYDKLATGTYYDAASGAVHDTVSYIQSLRNRRVAENARNLSAWDMGVGLYSAQMIGADTSEWVTAVKAQIDQLDGYHGYDVLGLAGAVLGLAAVDEDYDPQAGEHASASSLSDLVAILASYQISTGGFTWHALYMDPYFDETLRETVYGLRALNEFDRAGYLIEIIDAGNYLQSVQLATGGWEDYVGSFEGEENRISGEALHGIATAIGRPVTVPNVVGMGEADANLAIMAANLMVGEITYEYSDTISAGVVISQSPASGVTVLGSSAVDFAVSLGKAVVVPDVEGMSQTDANLTLNTAGLLVIVTYEFSNTVPAGVVISQNPIAETTVAEGSSVEITVSLGPPVVVPDVVGMNEPDANWTITSGGLAIGSTSLEYSDTVVAGTIISQNPAAGLLAPLGSYVDLVVSLGRPEVPDVIGETEANAASAIIDASLVIGDVTYEFSDTIGAGLVISQSPAGGTTVSVGSSVDLVVSLGRSTTVPNVVDMSQADADSNIVAAELVVGNIIFEHSDTVPAGFVISQDPIGGVVVAVGSLVDLVVSSGQPTVPNVVGETEAFAVSAITDVDNLVVGAVSYEHSETVPEGSVIDQSPAGGVVVPVGSAVDLVISLGPPALVPDVRGMTEAAAKTALVDAALAAGSVSHEYSSSVVLGSVVAQSPIGGTTVHVGSPVDLVISLGPPDPGTLSGGNRLVELQNNDGGWDEPLDDGNPGIGSDAEIFGYVAMGLVKAYRHDGEANDPAMLAALQKAKTFLLSRSDDFTVVDGSLAVELDDLLGGSDCVNHVLTNFYDRLTTGTYYDAISGAIHGTASYIQSLRDRRAAELRANMAAWDLGIALCSAYVIGAETTEWVAGLKSEIDELDGGRNYDVLGLAGAVLGLAAAGEDYDPQAGQHASASSLSDLAAILATRQLDTGAFTWHWPYMEEGMDEVVRETAYAIMALSEFDRAAYLPVVRDAGIYLRSVQLATGGWSNDAWSAENNLITGEALWGIGVMTAEPVVAPNTVGMGHLDANSAIDNVGLVIGSLDYTYHDTASAGVTLSQNPAGGITLPVGSAIDLVVSLGRPRVPDVIGMSAADANLAITGVDGLTISTVTYGYSGTIGAGGVMSQNPTGGTFVLTGSSVSIVVSLGLPVVPDVVDMPEADAILAITAIDNLTVSTVNYEHSDTVAAGLVISQAPAGGTVVSAGSSVELVVSLGQPIVPNVVGMSANEAVTTIEAVDDLAAAQSYAYDNNTPFGYIVSQSPAAGTVVSMGTTVNIVISLGQPLVPGVVGLSEAEARVAIKGVDELQVGTVSYAYSPTVAAGFVISQNPAGGTSVPIGTSVDFVVSLGQSSTVPAVVGATKAEAVTAITTAGLTVGSVTYEYNDVVAAAVVIRQSREAGTIVVAGSALDFVVSMGQPGVVMGLGGSRLVELLNNDGGWHLSPNGDPNVASDPNIFGSIATGLLQAYRQTGDPNMLAALQKSKLFLLGKMNNFAVTDGMLAVELDNILGGSECVDHVMSNFYDKLAAGTYYDAASRTTHDTASYVQSLRERRASQGAANLAAFDLGLGLYSVNLIGAETTEWINGVKAEIDELDGNHGYDVLGLAGAVYGLAAAGEDYDPQAGQHASASSLSDLAAILAGYQLKTGGFTWHWLYMEEGIDETLKETVYGLLTLEAFDRSSYLTQIRDAANYVQSVQLETGGWEDYLGEGENNENTGQALRAVMTIAPPPGDFDDDGDVDFKDYATFASSWLSDAGGERWNPDCDISYPNDDTVDALDLAVLLNNWLAAVEQ
ncbi:MAG TPA: PASTA domain-containing protein [Sedimentisphaerales bacterium]|nr:PASTA domain-containing protein [Sedimentisphaerales bacterium]